MLPSQYDHSDRARGPYLKGLPPHEESTERINLESEEARKEIKIATSLSAAERQKWIDLLRELRDVFAWSYRDMPGLDTAQTWWSTACLLKQNENASLFFLF